VSHEEKRRQDTGELVAVVTGRADAAAVPEDDVQRQLRKVLHAADELTPVVIHGEIGRGAFGVVYKGVLHVFLPFLLVHMRCCLASLPSPCVQQQLAPGVVHGNISRGAFRVVCKGASNSILATARL
jgi:hypothetical protein